MHGQGVHLCIKKNVRSYEPCIRLFQILVRYGHRISYRVPHPIFKRSNTDRSVHNKTVQTRYLFGP
jgi:hypothetical protein